MEGSRKPAPAELVGQVAEFLRPQVPAGSEVVVGYSGGLDSSVLLHVLHALREPLALRLGALHVHHGLSPHADVWAAHCQRVCAALGVPLTVRRVTVEPAGQGIEAAARRVRYREFASLAADFLLLAHHRDDQAETVLLRLLRGSGAHGLAAMPPARSLAPGAPRLLRPLLGQARTALRDYAEVRRIDWVEDDGNVRTDAARNWLRHDLLPEIERRYPGCRQVLANTAERLSETAGLVDDLARLDGRGAVDASGLRVSVLRALTPARALNLLRHWLYEATLSRPTHARLEEVLRQALAASPDRHPEFRLGDRLLRRVGDRLIVTAVTSSVASGEWWWRGEARLRLGDSGELCFTRCAGGGLAVAGLPAEGARVTWRVGGEHLRPACNRPRRRLKDLLREQRVPVTARRQLPLLWIGDRLAWVAGVGTECDFQARPGGAGWVIDWLPSG